MKLRFYDKSIPQLCAMLATDPNIGLTREEALARSKKYGRNAIYPIPRGSFLLYLRHMLTDFTALLLIFTAVIAAIFEKTPQTVVLLVTLAVYYASSIFAYVKAQRILERSGEHALPTAKVMRGGKLYMIRGEELVPGDVIFVSAGDIVPADARLLFSDGLAALEVNLTGAIKAVPKDAEFLEYRELAPGEQKNMLFASTILTSGTGRAVVCATGTDTLVCEMRKNPPVVSHEKLSVMTELKKFCRFWSLCMSAAIFLVTGLDLLLGFGGRGLFEIFITGLSLAVASMSEFYTAFGYIVVAVGVYGAVRKYRTINAGALIKNTAKLETIKRLTCLIVPREGAFSIRDMRLERVWTSGRLYGSDGAPLSPECAQTVKYALISTGLYSGRQLAANNQRFENIYTAEEEAIIRAAEKLSLYNVGLERTYPIIEHLAAGDETPGGISAFETTLVGYGGTYVVAVRGAPEDIISRCRYITEGGRVVELTHARAAELRVAASLAVKESYRVVAVASRTTVYNNLRRIITCQSDLTFEGFLHFREPMLRGAAQTVAKCRAAGIKVVMFCDEPDESNRYLARALGITESNAEAVTSSQLTAMKDGLIRANVQVYRLYEGLNITQKRLILKYLRESGEVVGVLGHELDEIILLKEADVGIAQSVTISDKAGRGGIELLGRNLPVFTKTAGERVAGGEALKFVSDVIVSEADRRGGGGFNAVVESVRHAKVIYLNLLRMTKYMIVSQFARLFLVFYSVLTGEPMLTPAQILFCGLIVDFAAILIIAFERPGRDILSQREETERKLRHPFLSNPQSIIFGLFWAAVTVLATRLLTENGIITGESDRYAEVFFSFILTQLATLGESMRERSLFVPNIRINGVFLLTLSMIIAFVAGCSFIPALGMLFGISSPPSVPLWGGIAVIPAIMLAIYEINRVISGKSE
jgi:Ca2+-transporting ATPase